MSVDPLLPSLLCSEYFGINWIKSFGVCWWIKISKCLVKIVVG